MRLNELLNEASIFDERTLLKTKWTNPKQLMAWLRKNGFQKKGSGAFSAVFVKPGYNRVIKISNKQDDCWIKFARWAQSVTNNPHLPNIPWVNFYTGPKGEQFFIAIMEKLAPFNQTTIDNTIDLPGLIFMYLHDDWFQENYKILSRLVDEGLVSREDPWNPNIRRRLLRYLREVQGGKRFILTLKAAEKKGTGKCAYDMHDGNIMYRPSDRRLVLIDPLADMNDEGFYID